MTQWGIDSLFNPAKRHMDEEKRRLQSTREEIGDSAGGKRIDLESGKVSISRAKDEDEDAPTGSATSGGTTSDRTGTPVEESPARARARARRARR
ncbi:MAG TPA: DUF6191 domain-containing protein [Jatrophihabitantaceae bacterium]|jgi:hypothetical protein|nr:DUF6191 domain-containing protein [Jatrophihabitantaceae bacterium]